jgi:hypothetical protein
MLKGFNMRKRTAYNGVPNAMCPWCGSIVLATGLKRHQRTEKCRKLTVQAERDKTDDSGVCPIMKLNENSTYSERLEAGFKATLPK